MPNWLRKEDEGTWAAAKSAALKTYKESDPKFFAVVTSIFKRMGGKVGVKAVGSLAELENGLKALESMTVEELAAVEAQAEEVVKAAAENVAKASGLDFASLANAAAAVQVAHWGADTVTNAHKALGELYSTLSGLVDDLAEAYAGRTKELPAAYPTAESVLGDVDKVVAEARAAVPEGSADLENILADMDKAVNKARYLLKAVEQGEGGDKVSAVVLKIVENVVHGYDPRQPICEVVK